MTAVNVVESVNDDHRESNKQGLFVNSEEMPGDQRTLRSLKRTFQFAKCRLRSSAIRRKSCYQCWALAAKK